MSFFSYSGTVFGEALKTSVDQASKKTQMNPRIISKKIDELPKSVNQEENQEENQKENQKERQTQHTEAVVRFNKGFYIESTDQQHKIKFTGRFHSDMRSHLSDHPHHTSFFMRRIRLSALGRFYRFYDIKIEVESGKGDSRLNNGFINIHYWPELQVQLGQFKTPFSMEELQSSNWIYFIERSLTNALAPSHDLGVMLHGSLQDQIFYYQLGVFNGYQANQSVDQDRGKDVAFRLVISPFIKSEHRVIKGLKLAGAMTYGVVNLNKAQWWESGDFKTAAETKYLSIKSDVVHDGDRARGGLDLYWDWGATAILAEYMITQFDGLHIHDQESTFEIEGGYILISHYLTGEHFTYTNGVPQRVVPLKGFKPDSSGWGAFQISARFEFVETAQELLSRGYVDETVYTNKAQGYTLGINWYPNEIVRFMLNYSHINFNDSVTVDGQKMSDEECILTRFQMAL